MFKVQWNHHKENKATLEHEEELRPDYPRVIPKRFRISMARFLLRGVGL
jgi:hypothetical protein